MLLYMYICRYCISVYAYVHVYVYLMPYVIVKYVMYCNVITSLNYTMSLYLVFCFDMLYSIIVYSSTYYILSHIMF